MDKELDRYVDNEIIREFANKIGNSYVVDIDGIETTLQKQFLDLLFEKDPVTKNIVLDRLQEVVDERIPWVESEDHYGQGLRPLLDAQTGEVIWL